MFSAPTAIRVLKKQDPSFLTKYDTSGLRTLFLAGEPLDEPTAKWIAEGIGRPIIDNYWQTETGWPILSVAHGIEKTPTRFGSPACRCMATTCACCTSRPARRSATTRKGVVAIVPPLPPGCLQTVWQDDKRFVDTYFSSIPGRQVYSTFDWGIRDDDGYYFILGRTDDVINVAGHRLGTREIEESLSSHSAVAECAVVGVADQLKGPGGDGLRGAEGTGPGRDPAGPPEARGRPDGHRRPPAGRGRPAFAGAFVTVLPKTRSGKVLRRSIQALCEGRDPGDLTTIEDPMALEQVRSAVAPG
jgi:propionyl-CoA synthetase